MLLTNKIRAAALPAVCAGMMLCGTARADDMNSKMKSGADHKFAMEAAQGGMAEVQLGNLAKDHASSDDVKKFGQQMVDDHSKANDQLKSIASQAGMTSPTDIGPKNQALMDRLSKLNGAAFDRAYMTAMVKDHKMDVADFQKEANSGKDANLKKFAADTLPTLQMHLKMAQDTASKTGSGMMKSGTGGHMDHDKK